MKHNKKAIVPAVIFFALVAYGLYSVLQIYAGGNGLTASGTIEATEVNLGTKTGGQVRQVFVSEGEAVSEGQLLAEVKVGTGTSAGYVEKIRSPINGVLLTRAIEPGEITTAGSTLLVVGQLETLTLTVYVPEERYGQVQLGQAYPVSVDSFPGRTFEGRVTRIADQAEFTPRNVQTVQGRKNTVYAVRLTLDNPDQALKPGMPADVRLAVK
jgi:multidrug efflux pump subunit AcrA (membrane-fusion protein)